MIVTMLQRITEYAITGVRALKQRRVLMIVSVTTLGAWALIFWLSAIFNPNFICYLMKLFFG